MKRSHGRRPVAYSAASMTVTTDEWRCLTASGSSRVVPEVYWNMAMSRPLVEISNAVSYFSNMAMKSSSAMAVAHPASAARSDFSGANSNNFGWQSPTRRRRPSGPNRVNSGTAMQPAFMAPYRAT